MASGVSQCCVDANQTSLQLASAVWMLIRHQCNTTSSQCCVYALTLTLIIQVASAVCMLISDNAIISNQTSVLTLTLTLQSASAVWMLISNQ